MDNNETCNLVELFEDRIKFDLKTTIFILMEMINSVFAIVGNLLVILVFIKERKLRQKLNFYIISLALADFGVGLFSIPSGIFVIITKIPTICHELLCLVPISIRMTFSNASIYSLVLISIKRYKTLSLNSPQPRPMSSKNVSKEISICWIFGVLIGFLPILWNNKEGTEYCVLIKVLSKNYIIFRFVTVVLIPLLIIGFVYIKIFRIIMKQMKKQAQLKKTSNKACEGDAQKSFKKEVNATINISLIVLMFFITWVPLQVLYLVTVLCKDCMEICSYVIWIAHFNSAINPLLYAYRMKDIRLAILKLFGAGNSLKYSSSA